MEERPKIHLTLSTTDKIAELTGWLLTVSIWGIIIHSYSDLPDTIPIHFNGAGQADRFGGKESIVILPLIATLAYIGLTVLNKYPHLFNYPAQVNSDNAFRQYTHSTRLVRYLKLILVVFFGSIAFSTIQQANGETDGLGTWFLPVIILLFLVPVIFFVRKSFALK